MPAKHGNSSTRSASQKGRELGTGFEFGHDLLVGWKCLRMFGSPDAPPDFPAFLDRVHSQAIGKKILGGPQQSPFDRRY